MHRPVIQRPTLFTFKISSDERMMLEHIARHHGESRSQAVRRLIRQAAGSIPGALAPIR